MQKNQEKEVIGILNNQVDYFFDVINNAKGNHFQKLEKNLFLKVHDVYVLFNPSKEPFEFSNIFRTKIVGDEAHQNLKTVRDELFGEYSSDQLNSGALFFYNTILFGCRAATDSSVNRKWSWLTEAYMFYGLGMNELIKHFHTTDLADKFASLLMLNSRAVLSERGKKAALARLENDPRQKEKELVYECWQQWQKTPNKYKSKAAFARDMLDKCEHLTSTKKIEDWCRQWETQNRNLAS